MFDFAEGCLVLGDVVAESVEDVLGVFGRHDDAALYLALRHIGSDRDEVDEKFVGRVSYYSEISIVAGSHFGSKFDFDFCLVFVCLDCYC